MITRETIARWLFPDIAKNAARYCRMRDQIRTEIWWLSEFPDVYDALRRILNSDLNYWRVLDEPNSSDIPDGISEFREMLRARASSHEMARLKSELARVLDANSRQASCIHQCAAVIGPDASATIDGLPRAVKHLVEQLQAITAERDLLQDILDTRPAINAGLPATYARWSQSIYSGDAVRAQMKGAEGEGQSNG